MEQSPGGAQMGAVSVAPIFDKPVESLSRKSQI